MTKTYLLLLLSCLTFISLKAQKDDKPHKITIIAGWNYSKVVSDSPNFEDTDYKSGLIVGINKDVKLTPFIWGNGGLLYYQNGADTEQGVLKFDYLSIPAGVKLRLGPVYGMGGAYLAYRLSAKLDDEDLNNNDFNRIDFGTYVGAGVKFLIFSLNAKYNWGLSNLRDGTNTGVTNDEHNRFFSLALGVGIP